MLTSCPNWSSWIANQVGSLQFFRQMSTKWESKLANLADIFHCDRPITKAKPSIAFLNFLNIHWRNFSRQIWQIVFVTTQCNIHFSTWPIASPANFPKEENCQKFPWKAPINSGLAETSITYLSRLLLNLGPFVLTNNPHQVYALLTSNHSHMED